MVFNRTLGYLRLANHTSYKTGPADDKRNIATYSTHLQRLRFVLEISILPANSIVYSTALIHTQWCFCSICVILASFCDCFYVLGLFRLGNYICTRPCLLLSSDVITTPIPSRATPPPMLAGSTHDNNLAQLCFLFSSVSISARLCFPSDPLTIVVWLNKMNAISLLNNFRIYYRPRRTLFYAAHQSSDVFLPPIFWCLSPLPSPY